MIKTRFRIGDKVWSKHLGVGVIISINDDPDVSYPIRVRWIDKNPESSTSTDVFTMDGHYLVNGGYPDCDIYLYELGKYRVGDKVYAPFKYGTITAIYSDGRAYPIEVTWELSTNNTQETGAYTADGRAFGCGYEGFPSLTVIERPLSKGDKIVDTKYVTFKVGDRVWSQHSGVGVVVSIDADAAFPIKVRWSGGNTDVFTTDGRDALDGTDQDYTIYLLTHREDETTKDNTTEYTAIDPAHYRVKGIPEAIEIMEHLMTKEQLEGFLWGNIIKYAYRYGRKGDEVETAGKIKWYANKLEEVCAEEKKERERE